MLHKNSETGHFRVASRTWKNPPKSICQFYSNHVNIWGKLSMRLSYAVGPPLGLLTPDTISFSSLILKN